MTDAVLTSERPTGFVPRAIAPIFALTMGVSAGLLFAVQPMFSKMTLPLLGGSPGVWNTAVAFFQGVLLLGYLYAHALSRHLPLRRQALLHAVVLIFGAFALPLSVSTLLGDPPQNAQAFWLLGLFALSVGAPVFAITATAPLLQSWYASSGRPDAHDPYYLYAASNLGSMAALIAYPLIIEPGFAISAQSIGWSAGYGALAVAVLACAGVAGLSARTTRSDDAPGLVSFPVKAANDAGRNRERLVWVLLAFAPSSLLLGVTTHLTTDVASAPFLWTLPLALYLGTFVIAFAKRPIASHSDVARLAPIFAIAAALIITRPALGWATEAAIHLAAFFMLALLCHGELVRRRPSADRLTEFYVFMSLGGVLGGAFNAFVAPIAFDRVIEYPLVFAAALLARPAAQLAARRVVTVSGICIGGLIAMVVLNAALPDVSPRLVWLGLAIAALTALGVRESRIAFAVLAGAVMMAAGAASPNAGAIAVERGFFGVHRVVERGEYRVLLHGTTIHGVQGLEPGQETLPMAYYGPLTPIAQTITGLQAQGRLGSVGAVGLGAGSIACYAREGESWTFFEIDPLVVKLARDPEHFRFLSDCGPDMEIVLGDARITLPQAGAGAFDLLVLDAFSSDVVPAHLLTREAVALYLSSLSENGVIAFHISNRVMALEGPLADVAASLDAAALVQVFRTPEGVPVDENQSSKVMLIAKDPAALAVFAQDPRWRSAEPNNGRVWSDDYVNVLGAIWQHFRGRS